MIPNINSRGYPGKYAYNHYQPHFKGSDCYNYKGWTIDSHGYKLIYKPDHPYCSKRGYVFEHRLIMEKHIGRYLTKKEVVHHKNKIVDDNRIENLEIIVNQGEHSRIHNRGRQYSKKDMSGRICLQCGTDKTYVNPKGHHRWFTYQDGFVCMRCYGKHYEKTKRKKRVTNVAQ